MTPRSVDCQAPGSMGFSRQEYWSGLPCPPPGNLPDPGIEPRSPSLQADSLLSEPPGKPVNTGVGSLPLLQGIFPTQQSNQSPLHCRQIFTSWASRESLVHDTLKKKKIAFWIQWNTVVLTKPSVNHTWIPSFYRWRSCGLARLNNLTSLKTSEWKNHWCSLPHSDSLKL